MIKNAEKFQYLKTVQIEKETVPIESSKNKKKIVNYVNSLKN